MLSLLLQDTAAVFIYFSGVVTWALVCICAWDTVAGLDSLIAGFWTSASRSTECRWVNYGTILKWVKFTDFVYVVGTWMAQFAALKQHSVIYYVQRLRSNVGTICCADTAFSYISYSQTSFKCR
jgi:hypothetical protein